MMLDEIQQRLIEFAAKRDWEKFQSPKNLSMALSVEAAELLEHFQWKSEEESKHLSDEDKKAISYELADVFMYTLLLAKRMDIDLPAATQEKITINEKRYPADIVRGSAKKHDQY